MSKYCVFVLVSCRSLFPLKTGETQALSRVQIHQADFMYYCLSYHHLYNSWQFTSKFLSPFFEIWCIFRLTLLQKNQRLPSCKFKFTFMSEETVLKLLKDMDENQAEGLDKLSGKFLKDGVTVLAKLISWICNSSIKYSILLTVK